MLIPFGPWEPDSAGLDAAVNGAPILADAKNAVPQKVGYGALPSLSEMTSAELPDKCVGLFKARTEAGGWILFAGTRTALFRLVSDSWVDYSRLAGGAYDVPTDDYWSFIQFGGLLIACNINDDVQYIDIDAGSTNFAALGGSPPPSRYVAVVGDFLVLACHSANNRMITNSAINDATGWTLGVDLCDQQEFPDGGRVTGMAGGEFGWVTQERAIRRMIFQQGDIAFRFERVEQERGAAAGYSVISSGNSIFFIADDGFYGFSATGLVPIGGQRVNEWFRENSDTTRFFSVLGFSDPNGARIYWAFYNTSGSTDFDRVLIYDWQLDRWAYSDQSAQFWATMVTPGVTLEDLDVYGSIDEGVPFSLDSRVWEGGAPLIAAIGPNGRLSALEGAVPQTALLRTCSMGLVPGSRAMVQSVNPIGAYNGATLAVRVGKREHTKNAAVNTAPITPSTRTGVARLRASGRYHEFELTVSQSSGAVWEFAQGFDVTAVPDGLK